MVLVVGCSVVKGEKDMLKISVTEVGGIMV